MSDNEYMPDVCPECAHHWVLVEAWAPEVGNYEFWQCHCGEQRDA